MKKFKYRLYTATLVNQFGNWLAFLAIALFVKENYGAERVVETFLIQSLPHLFLSQAFAQLVPLRLQAKTFVCLEVLLALSSCFLAFALNLSNIYVFLFVTSVIKALEGPLFQNLSAQWTSKDDHAEVFTRISAIRSSVLALAPALGGVIGSFLGLKFLLLIDAASFLIALAFLYPWPASTLTKSVEAAEKKTLLSKVFNFSLFSLPETHTRLKRALGMWAAIGLLGAYLNAIEFPLMDALKLSRQQTGLLLSCWGAGNLLAFVLAARLKKKMDLFYSLLLFSISLLLLPLSQWNEYAIWLAFFAGAFSLAFVSGAARTEIQKAAEGNKNPLRIWAFANQATALSNLIFYGSMSFLLQLTSVWFLSWGLFGCAILFTLLSLKEAPAPTATQSA